MVKTVGLVFIFSKIVNFGRYNNNAGIKRTREPIVLKAWGLPVTPKGPVPANVPKIPKGQKVLRSTPQKTKSTKCTSNATNSNPSEY